MTPLSLSGEVVAWRIDRLEFADTWDSGEGARLFGGRWNRQGARVLYCAIDPSTAILEVAVHRGFRTLDRSPHVLTSISVPNPAEIRIVRPEEIPDPDWLNPGTPTIRQQEFGQRLLETHRLVAVPSVVSRHSWNLVVSVPASNAGYRLRSQEPFVLDPRLHAAAP